MHLLVRSPGGAAAAACFVSLLAALMLGTAAAAGPPSCQCAGAGSPSLRLRASPCSTKCTASLDAAEPPSGGGGCRLTVACWNSTSTEPAELAQDDLSALLSEAAARFSTRAVASLRLSFNRTHATLSLNATGLAALKRLSYNCQTLRVSIGLQSSRLVRVDPGFLDSLAGDVTIEATDTVWALETASDAIDFGNGSVARLRLEGPSLTSQTMALRNLRAASVELRLAAEDNARRPVDWGLPAPSPPTLRLSNIHVTGSLSVDVAIRGHSKAKLASWTLALEDITARELRLAGYLHLTRPLRHSLASLAGLTVEAGADLLTSKGSRPPPLLEDIDSWAPGLRRLRLADSGRLAAAVLERRQLTGLLARRLLPQLQRLDLRGCGRLRLPEVAKIEGSDRCSEISFMVDDELVVECNCRLDWLATRCLNSSRVRVLCASRGPGPEQRLVPYESYSATSCPGEMTSSHQGAAASNASSGGQEGKVESLTLILWVLLALSLAAILAGLTVMLAVFSSCQPSKLLASSEKAEKLRSESNSSDESAASASERARSENATNLNLLR